MFVPPNDVTPVPPEDAPRAVESETTPLALIDKAELVDVAYPESGVAVAK